MTGMPVRVLVDPAHAGARAVATWASRQVAGRPPEPPDPDRPGLGSRWGSRHEPDEQAAPAHELAHEQFVAAFDALRPLRLGRPPRTALLS